MTLPANDTAWPPPGHSQRYGRFPLLSAWYSGDPAQLGSAYGARMVTTTSGGPGTTLNPRGTGVIGRVMGAVRNEFWTTTTTDEQSNKRHLPVPEDICRLSSEALFSEPLQIRVEGPRDAEGKPAPETVAAQQRLERLLDKCKFQSLLLAAGEIGSALGSYGLRIAFDKENRAIAKRPVIVRADADEMVPWYSWGQLSGVTFWRVVEADHDRIWRHLEHHEGGKVFHALYEGSQESIGKRRGLAEHRATERLAQLVDPEGAIVLLKDGGTTAVSVANMLPDPLDRKSYAGRSDFTPAVLDLFDAIDRIYSQMMDSIDDARSRLLIDDSMLNRGKPGEGVNFDPSQRIFTKLRVPPAEREGGGLPIEKVQFEMKIAEYWEGISRLISLAIHAAGFNPDTEATENSPEMTATEYRGKNARTLSTRDKKIGYAVNELEELLTSFLALDVQEFPSVETVRIVTGEGDTATVEERIVAVKPFPVSVTFPDAVQPTQMELAATAKALEGVTPLIDRIRTAHPDWDETRLRTARDELQAESARVDAAVIGLAGTGVGRGDGI